MKGFVNRRSLIVNRLSMFFIIIFLLLATSYRLPTAVYAQTTKSSNQWLTKVGNPTQPPPSLIGGSIFSLVDKLKASKNCESLNTKARVNIANVVSCVDSIKPLNTIAEGHIKTSAITYTNLQCVGFVKASVGEDKGANLDDHGVANARQYATNPPTGYTFIPKSGNKAQVGDLAIWGSSGSGHVAYVINVDERAFTVAEANWGLEQTDRGRVQTRIVDPSVGEFIGWARK